jgi:hypothetical protein
MHTKKKTSRFHADRVSRNAVSTTNRMFAPYTLTRSATLPSRRYTRASASDAIS